MFKLDLFSDIAEVLNEAAIEIRQASSLSLVSEPSLIGVLGLAQIEAALIDAGIAYRRRISEATITDLKNSIVISALEETNWNSESKTLVIGPITVQAKMGHDSMERTGVLESTSQAAALAAVIAPKGKRVRNLRGWSCSGQWLRETMDQVYDPVWTILRNHLRDEGSVRILPLPEVDHIAEEEMKGLSKHSLGRLRKAWPTMDFELRSSALSELMMIVASSSEKSAPRLEELGWHRVHNGSWPSDLFSMLYNEKNNWLEGGSIAHSSKILDSLISKGHF